MSAPGWALPCVFLENVARDALRSVCPLQEGEGTRRERGALRAQIALRPVHRHAGTAVCEWAIGQPGREWGPIGLGGIQDLAPFAPIVSRTDAQLSPAEIICFDLLNLKWEN